jgi:hypothetical protein
MASVNRMQDNAVLKGLARPCWRKQKWATEAAAQAQLRSIVKRGLEKDPERIRVYKCPCGAWHVGHRPLGWEK